MSKADYILAEMGIAPKPAHPETGVDRNTATHFVHMSPSFALFVKDGNFFRHQGGNVEEWGKTWVPVMAASIGDARRQAATLFGVEVSHIHYGEV